MLVYPTMTPVVPASSTILAGRGYSGDAAAALARATTVATAGPSVPTVGAKSRELEELEDVLDEVKGTLDEPLRRFHLRL